MIKMSVQVRKRYAGMSGVASEYTNHARIVCAKNKASPSRFSRNKTNSGIKPIRYIFIKFIFTHNLNNKNINSLKYTQQILNKYIKYIKYFGFQK